MLIRHACFPLLSRVRALVPIGGCLAGRTHDPNHAFGRYSFKRSIALGVALLALISATASANAVGTVSCRFQRDLTGASGIAHIRIQMRARFIDNYLPRCDLANFVAADGRRRFSEHGARWFVGVFMCVYSRERVPGRDELEIHGMCVHHGAYASTVWFDSYA